MAKKAAPRKTSPAKAAKAPVVPPAPAPPLTIAEIERQKALYTAAARGDEAEFVRLRDKT